MCKNDKLWSYGRLYVGTISCSGAVTSWSLPCLPGSLSDNKTEAGVQTEISPKKQTLFAGALLQLSVRHEIQSKKSSLSHRPVILNAVTDTALENHHIVGYFILRRNICEINRSKKNCSATKLSTRNVLDWLMH